MFAQAQNQQQSSLQKNKITNYFPKTKCRVTKILFVGTIFFVLYYYNDLLVFRTAPKITGGNLRKTNIGNFATPAGLL